MKIGELIPVFSFTILLFCTCEEPTKSEIVETESIAKIVFASERDSALWEPAGIPTTEIYIMDSDGGNQERLTYNLEWDLAPRFSPDGSKILFRSSPFAYKECGYKREIYIMNTDGSNLTRLTGGLYYGSYPAFSPDVLKLVFTLEKDECNLEIYTIDIDGTNLTRLTNHPKIDEYPQFSPDGSKILFTSNRDGSWDIFTMDVNGDDQINLTEGGGVVEGLFSPDGSKIMFLSDRDGNREVYIMNIDRSGQTNLTNSPHWEYDPQFQPQP